MGCLLPIIMLLPVPIQIEDIYLKNYCLDACLLYVTVLLYGWHFMKKRYDIFSPITLVTFLHVMIFYVTPMYDILNEKIYWFGVDLFEYGIKGSWIAFLGYLSFFAAYSIGFRKRREEVSEENADDEGTKKAVPKSFVRFIFCIYAVSLLINIYYVMVVTGNNLLYIFSLGLLGGGTIREAADVGVFSVLAYVLPSTTILYMEYGKNKKIGYLMFMLMFILQVARGFRYFIFQIAIMFTAYHYLKKNKKPEVKKIVLLFLIVLVPVIIMTLFRDTIRGGEGFNLTGLSMDILFKAMDEIVWFNLRIYKTYYGVIRAVPEMTGYLFGKQMILYTLVIFVPRVLWKGKPLAPGGDAIALGITQSAVHAGSAYPYLGEYFYDSGIAGVVIWMFVFGLWMKTINEKYRNSGSSKIDLMIYCSILGCLLQIIIRGYTPSNFWMVLVGLLPFYAVKFLYKID